MIRRLLPFCLLGALALGGCATVDTPRIPSDALPAKDSSFGRSIQAQAAPTLRTASSICAVGLAA